MIVPVAELASSVRFTGLVKLNVSVSSVSYKFSSMSVIETVFERSTSLKLNCAVTFNEINIS